MQLKFDHGYFKSYLTRIPNQSIIKKCYGRCHENQDPEHLLTKCRHFADQQSILIKKNEIVINNFKNLIHHRYKIEKFD